MTSSEPDKGASVWGRGLGFLRIQQGLGDIIETRLSPCGPLQLAQPLHFSLDTYGLCVGSSQWLLFHLTGLGQFQSLYGLGFCG